MNGTQVSQYPDNVFAFRAELGIKIALGEVATEAGILCGQWQVWRPRAGPQLRMCGEHTQDPASGLHGPLSDHTSPPPQGQTLSALGSLLGLLAGVASLSLPLLPPHEAVSSLRTGLGWSASSCIPSTWPRRLVRTLSASLPESPPCLCRRQLCDLRQVALPLWALFSAPGKQNSNPSAHGWR